MAESGNGLRHILVGTDESESARNALRTALVVAHRAGARLTVMTVIPMHGRANRADAVPEASHGPVLARLERWMDAELRTSPEVGSVGLGVTSGIPGIEICRFADDHAVDLMVIGRKTRSRTSRLLVGDTADAVARRSRIPCLFVPRAGPAPSSLLVALDGSARGLTVLETACDIARAIGAGIQVVTVEPVLPDEPSELALELPTARSEAVRVVIGRIAACHDSGVAMASLMIRRGAIPESVLAAAAEIGSDVIVVGMHRGGPPGIIDAGSTARRLTHSADCAVLTVPL